MPLVGIKKHALALKSECLSERLGWPEIQPAEFPLASEGRGGGLERYPRGSKYYDKWPAKTNSPNLASIGLKFGWHRLRRTSGYILAIISE